MMVEQTVAIVDDCAGFRESMRALLESIGLAVRGYPSAFHFLADYDPKAGCLIADIRLPEMSGLELQEEIVRRGMNLPVIFITAQADVPLAVRAMKAGAVDFIEKPFDEDAMIAGIKRALEIGRQIHKRIGETKNAMDALALLTQRERHVFDHLVKGHSNKAIACQLGISPRTVEFHRAHIMGKMNARSLSDLVHITMAAGHSMLDNASMMTESRRHIAIARRLQGC
ncbi:MAG TPA: response regulator [Rhizomicrobium sp.]|nr:response regulator [Rhizomicrobium sp.]